MDLDSDDRKILSLSLFISEEEDLKKQKKKSRKIDNKETIKVKSAQDKSDTARRSDEVKELEDTDKMKTGAKRRRRRRRKVLPIWRTEIFETKVIEINMRLIDIEKDIRLLNDLEDYIKLCKL